MTTTKRNLLAGKAAKIIYWIATVWLASGMLATGVQQLMKVQLEEALSPPGVYGITQLGYPVYLLTILGVWKLLSVVALLLPAGRLAFLNLVREWTYAGIFFLLSGAIFSHIAVNHPMMELFPATLLLVLTVVSWYFRPEERRLSR